MTDDSLFLALFSKRLINRLGKSFRPNLKFFDDVMLYKHESLRPSVTRNGGLQSIKKRYLKGKAYLLY